MATYVDPSEFSRRASNRFLAQQLAETGVRNMQTVAARQLVEGFAVQATGGVAKVMDLYVGVLQRNYRNRRGRMKKINSVVAEDVRDKVLLSYATRVGRDQGPSGYRANASGKWKRYSGGKMEQGLEDPGFITAAYDGINFANMNVMDRHAKQWYRLNFGAGPRGAAGGKYRPGEYRLNLFGAATGAPVSLKQYPASEQYWMPKGLFYDASTGSVQRLSSKRQRLDVFQPRKAPVDKLLGQKLSNPQGASRALIKQSGVFWKGGPSQGFAGYHFLDAGVRRLAGIWPLAMVKLINEWVEEAATVGTGPVSYMAMTPSDLNAVLGTLTREMNRLANQDKYAGILARLEQSRY